MEKWFLRLIIFFSIGSIFLNLIRISSLTKSTFSDDGITWTYKGTIISLFLVALITIFLKWENKRTAAQKVIGRIILLLLGFNLIATIIGLMNGFQHKILSDIFNSISGLTIAYAVAGFSINRDQAKQFLKEFSIAVTIAFIISLILMEIGRRTGDIYYLALVPTGLALSLFYFGKKEIGGTWGKIGIVTLFLLSLKRSLILGFMFSLFLFWTVKKGKNVVGSFSIITGGMLISLLTIFGIAKMGEGNTWPVFGNTIKKINQVNPFVETTDLWRDSGGARLSEVISAYKTFQGKSYNWWLGAGNGFVYLDYHETTEGTLLHNVHISPFSFIFRLGIIMSGIIFYIIGRYINWIIIQIRKQDGTLQPFLFYQIFGLVATLFSYSLAVDVLLWTTMGIVCALFNSLDIEEGEKNFQPVAIS